MLDAGLEEFASQHSRAITDMNMRTMVNHYGID